MQLAVVVQIHEKGAPRQRVSAVSLPEQHYRSSWAFTDGSSPSIRNEAFRQASNGINGVDWEGLPDFGSIIRAARDAPACLLGLGVPRKLGGLGLTPRQSCQLFREFERLDTTSSHTVGYQNSLGVFPLLFSGKMELGGYLEKIARGQMISSFVITEPQGGSHMRGMQKFATRDISRPGKWILNGTKGNIAHAQAAGVFLVSAQAKDGFKVFIVPSNSPGVSVTRTVNPVYMSRIYINEISFHNVEVDDSHCIENEKVIYDSMMATRTFILAGKIGHVERCLDLLRPFVASRLISTGRMSENPYVKRRIERMEIHHRVLSGLMEFILQQEEQVGVSYDLAMTAKVVGVAAAMEASTDTQSLFGAKSVDPATRIAKATDDVRNWKYMDGASEPVQHFLAVNYMTARPWSKQFVARHPKCFAPISQHLSRHTSAATEFVTLGEAVAWAITKAACIEVKALDNQMSWICDHAIERALAECVGPPSKL